jgi:hypothetical protein
LSGMRQLPTRKNYKAKPSVSPPPPEKPKPAPKAAPKRKRGGGTATRSVKTKAKRRKISAKRDPETESAEALAQLDDWQTTFVRFLTLPSQHVYEKTGDPVPLRSVATWGRQKVKWSTANARTGTTQVPADKGGNVVSHKLFEEAKSKTSTRRSSQGGTNSSLVPSATLGSSDNKPRAMIRMSEAEALRFHDEEHNHDFGEWISKERKLFVERQISPKAPPLFPKKRHDESKEESVSLIMTKDAPKPEREDIDLRFAHVQQSFRFNLLRMCGVDLERIDSRDTMIQRKVNDPSRKHPKNKKNALPALFDLDVMDDSEFQLDANFMEM